MLDAEGFTRCADLLASTPTLNMVTAVRMEPGSPASPVLACWDGGVCFLNADWRSPNSRSCAGADRGCGPGGRDAKKRPLAGLPSGVYTVLHGAFPHQSTRCSAAAKRAARSRRAGARACGPGARAGTRVGGAAGHGVSRRPGYWLTER